MADSDSFTCPSCNKETTIAKMECWEVYEEDGAQNDITCPECKTNLVIISIVTGWSFEAELPE